MPVCFVIVRDFGWPSGASYEKEELTMPKASLGFCSRYASRLLIALAVACACENARAADYLLDQNYGGVNGAPFGSYTAAYSDIASALAAVPAGSSASNPNRLFIAPG